MSGCRRHAAGTQEDLRRRLDKHGAGGRTDRFTSREFQKLDERKFTSASAVCSGRSSMIQWPAPGTMTTVTFEATSLDCSASNPPIDFSPPSERSGIPSRVFESSANSLASTGHEAK